MVTCNAFLIFQPNFKILLKINQIEHNSKIALPINIAYNLSIF